MSFDGECTIDEGNVELSNVTACETGPSADPDKSCSSGQFCELDTGECNAKSAVFDGVCTNIPEACTLEYNPVRTDVQVSEVSYISHVSKHYFLTVTY